MEPAWLCIGRVWGLRRMLDESCAVFVTVLMPDPVCVCVTMLMSILVPTISCLFTFSCICPSIYRSVPPFIYLPCSF